MRLIAGWLQENPYAGSGKTYTWKETGLPPFQSVNYACGATDVGVVVGCVYKNKLISATQLIVAKNVFGEGGGGEGEAFIANARGVISGSTTTTVEGEGGEGLCPEGEFKGQQPEVEAVAVRWCNASLTDTTNNIVGATQTELFAQLVSGTVTVPSCAELATMPPTPGEGG